MRIQLIQERLSLRKSHFGSKQLVAVQPQQPIQQPIQQQNPQQTFQPQQQQQQTSPQPQQNAQFGFYDNGQAISQEDTNFLSL